MHTNLVIFSSFLLELVGIAYLLAAIMEEESLPLLRILFSAVLCSVGIAQLFTLP